MLTKEQVESYGEIYGWWDYDELKATAIELYAKLEKAEGERDELREAVKKAMVLIHNTDEYFEGMNILATIIGIKVIDWSHLKSRDALKILGELEAEAELRRLAEGKDGTSNL